LTITDVISTATPIIEEFAGGPIAYWKQGRSSGSLSFEALYFMTRAFTDEANQRKTTESQLSRSTVSRLLRKFRKRKSVQIAQNEDLVRVDIAPELRAWMQ
jgi:hypothetical protein